LELQRAARDVFLDGALGHVGDDVAGVIQALTGAAGGDRQTFVQLVG